MLVDYNNRDSEISVTFDYDVGLVALIKTVPGRRWDAKTKTWRLPSNGVSVACLKNLGIELTTSDNYRKWCLNQIANKIKQTDLLQRAVDVSVKIPEIDNFKFDRQPYKHQLEALRFMWLCEANGFPYGALLLEMGLGKTKIAIDFCRLKKLKRVLIVVPKSIAMVWEDEVKRDDKAAIAVDMASYNSTKKRIETLQHLRNENSSRRTYLILNHDAFRASEIQEELIKWDLDIMFVDESSFIKTHTAKRTKAIVKVGKSAARRYIMTGTPVTNSWLDAFSQFFFLEPTILGLRSLTAFKATYVIYGGWENRQIQGYKNTEHLEMRIQLHSIRRKLAECIDLPEKIYQVHAVDLPPDIGKQYRKMQKDLMIELNGLHKTEEVFVNKETNQPEVRSKLITADGKVISTATVLTKILSLTQITSGFVTEHEIIDGQEKVKVIPLSDTPPKLDALIELISVLPEDEKAIIACRFRWDVQRLIQEIKPYGKVGVLMGNVDADFRKDVVRDFQEGDCRFILGTPKTFGYGLTLTRARHMIFYSTDYSLDTRYQAEARIHRVGQDKTVIYHDLVCKHTIDEVMLQCVRNKKNLLDYVMGLDKLLL